MCGIIGIYGEGVNKWQNPKKNFILDGLYVDAVRGYDSTGIALLPRNPKDHVNIYKRDLSGYDFIQQKHTNRLVGLLDQSIGIIGHNRSATRGAPSDRNAHPFRHGRITLVHNGTVSNADRLVDKKEHPDGCVVDSEFVAHALSLESANDILPRLQGGYSLVWFDSEERSLNFARNDSKPMWILFDSADENLYFGSEPGMITWLCERHHITVQEPIYKTDSMCHYIIKNPGKVKEIEKRPFLQGLSSTIKDRMQTIGRQSHTADTTGTSIIQHPTAPWHPTDKESLRRESTNTSRTEAARPNTEGYNFSEALSAGDASGIRVQAKDNRHHELVRVLEDHNCPTSLVACRILKWYAYETRASEPVNQNGYVIAYPIHKDVKEVFFQVFHVDKKSYEEYKEGLILVEPINFRKNRTPTTIVARIVEDVQQKYQKRREERKEQRDSGGLIDHGTKDDWIQIGTTNKRWVDPFDFWDIVKRGCYNCNEPVDDDPAKIMWTGVNDDKPLCDRCCDDDMVVTQMANVN